MSAYFSCMLEIANVLSIINWLMWPFVFKHVHSVTLNFAVEQLHLKLSLDMQLLADKQCVLQSLEKVEKQQLCLQLAGYLCSPCPANHQFSCTNLLFIRQGSCL